MSMQRSGRQTFDAERASLSLAFLKKNGSRFEIIIDPDLAVSYKEGDKSIDIREVIHGEKIMSNSQRGLAASMTQLKEIFGTDDIIEISEKILQEGEIQFSAEYRKNLLTKKRQRIIDVIHRNAVDPKTKYPHPKVRLENAFEEAKIRIDEFKPIQQQVRDIIKKLQVILPISLESELLEVHVPEKYSHKCYELFKKYGQVKKEDWISDGALLCKIEVPSGLRLEFIDELNNMTHGGVEIKLLESLKQ